MTTNQQRLNESWFRSNGWQMPQTVWLLSITDKMEKAVNLPTYSTIHATSEGAIKHWFDGEYEMRTDTGECNEDETPIVAPLDADDFLQFAEAVANLRVHGNTEWDCDWIVTLEQQPLLGSNDPTFSGVEYFSEAWLEGYHSAGAQNPYETTDDRRWSFEDGARYAESRGLPPRSS